MASKEVKKTAPDAHFRKWGSIADDRACDVSMIELTDSTGAKIRLVSSPRRIVSLVPSTTETVYALDGGPYLVGVTRYCVHPTEARLRARVVGGTKSPKIDLIRELEPDLVLANQEENREEDVTALRRFAPVHVAFPQDVASAIGEIVHLGKILGRDERGHHLEREILRSLGELRKTYGGRYRFRYIYLIWKNPYMAAGRDTFIDAFIAEAGGENAAELGAGRYPELTARDIERAHPDVILMASEPFPFVASHIDELLEQMTDRAPFEKRTLLVDGELLSWHGVRLLEGIPYLANLKERISKLPVTGGR